MSLNELSLDVDFTPWAFRRVLQFSNLSKSTTELPVRLRNSTTKTEQKGWYVLLLTNKKIRFNLCGDIKYDL